MREQEVNILLLLNSIKYNMLSFHSDDIRQTAWPREREKSNIRTLGRVQTVKSHSLGHKCLIKIPTHARPPPLPRDNIDRCIIWIYPLLYWNFWNKDQFAAKYMQVSPYKFRRYVSENAKNVHFREAKRTRAFGARYYFCRTNFELFPPGLLFPIGNTPYNITYLTYTKGCFFSQ